jgi:hypothetical protein
LSSGFHVFIEEALSLLEQLSLYPCRGLDETIADQLRRWIIAYHPREVEELKLKLNSWTPILAPRQYKTAGR